jgi:hypothetical protein
MTLSVIRLLFSRQKISQASELPPFDQHDPLFVPNSRNQAWNLIMHPSLNNDIVEVSRKNGDLHIIVYK